MKPKLKYLCDMLMKDYYNLFIKLCLYQCTKNDYVNKQKVKANNVALKKLAKLQAEMKKFDCTDILNMLLSHKDDRVKLNAASLCLQKGVLIEEATLALKTIIDSSGDATFRFSAKMLLGSKSTDNRTGDG